MITVLNFFRRQAFIAIGVMALALVSWTFIPAFAAEEPGGQAEAPGLTLAADIVIKRPDYVVAADENGNRRRLAVCPETEIYKADGTRIALKYLVFPCQAKIELVAGSRQKDGMPCLRQIKVQETSNLGTSKWSPAVPE